MRIAVTYQDGLVFPHFGHTSQFKLYDVENGQVVRSQVVSTNGQGHGALAALLGQLQADTLICGGIGGGAQAALASAGIRVHTLSEYYHDSGEDRHCLVVNYSGIRIEAVTEALERLEKIM